jgi:phospholipid/cholesterol/gamma-HCH transport system ATP-binding protein
MFDEPDSGLDPVRVAYLNQLIVDLNAQTDSTFLIVTHDIGTARTVPDNLGLLFRRELVMFGPREVLLTSEEPVVKQFLNGRKEGPIGMSEEKDAAQVAAELAAVADPQPPAPGTGPKGATGAGVPPQLQPSDGLPERKAAARRQQRVLEMLHTLPPAAQTAIRTSLGESAEWSTGPGLSAERAERPARLAVRPGWDGRPDDQSGRQPVAAEPDRSGE